MVIAEYSCSQRKGRTFVLSTADGDNQGIIYLEQAVFSVRRGKRGGASLESYHLVIIRIRNRVQDY